MNGFVIRKANVNDISFLVNTIIEAEKSGTDRLSYSTIFGLSEEESKRYINQMLLEEIDGCELSISSFLLAERNGRIAAAVGAWIEGIEGSPSSVLKGNLLSYILPKECLEKALSLNAIIRELHIENIQDTIQIGLVYVSIDYRGMNLAEILINEQIKRLLKIKPDITNVYVQVFADNIRAIKTYEKAKFEIVLVKESSNEKILNYLPSNKKVLMKRKILKK